MTLKVIKDDKIFRMSNSYYSANFLINCFGLLLSFMGVALMVMILSKGPIYDGFTAILASLIMLLPIYYAFSILGNIKKFKDIVVFDFKEKKIIKNGRSYLIPNPIYFRSASSGGGRSLIPRYEYMKIIFPKKSRLNFEMGVNDFVAFKEFIDKNTELRILPG